MSVFRLNVVAWLCQLAGTLFLLMDSIRVSIRLPREGVTLGDPVAVDKWYYHWASPIGFFLLFLGFGLFGVALWISWSRTLVPSTSDDIDQAVPIAETLELEPLLLHHRHEDNLFDRRLYSLLVATAFLFAAFAQFRQFEHFGIATAIACAGSAIAVVFGLVLRRAARALDWSNRQIRRSEAAEAANERIYTARDRAVGRAAATVRLGYWIPAVILLSWLLLWLVLLYLHLGSPPLISWPWGEPSPVTSSGLSQSGQHDVRPADAVRGMEGALQGLGGFFLGVLASAIAAIILDRGARPRLTILEDNGGRAQGQNPGDPPHEFFHVRIRNLRAKWPLAGRRPAWSSQATLEILTEDGRQTILGPIPARWSSQPEPILRVGVGGAVAQIPDVARMLAGRRIDVHNHEDQLLCVALKYQGAPECHLFTNESYASPRGQNPAWALQPGRHRLRVTVYYERGRQRSDFWIRNNGASRDDVHVETLGE